MATASTDSPKRSTGRPPPWRDVRVLAWAFQLAIVAAVVAFVAWLYDNFRVNSDGRTFRPVTTSSINRPASRSPAATSARPSRFVTRSSKGFSNTLRLAVTGIVLATIFGVLLGIARLSKNFIVRSAAQGLRRVRPQRPAAGDPLLAVHRQWCSARFPRRLVLGLRPAGRPERSRRVVAVDRRRELGDRRPGCGRRSAAAWATSRWRRAVSDRTGRPARPGLWVFGVTVVVGVGDVDRAGSRHHRTGDRWTARLRWHHDDARVLRGPGGTRRLHREPHRRDRAGFDPGRAARARARRPTRSPSRASSARGTSFSPRRCASPSHRSATSTSTWRRTRRWPAVISFPELTKVTQLTVSNRSPAVPAFVLLLAIYLVLSLVISSVVNLANRRLAIVER